MTETRDPSFSKVLTSRSADLGKRKGERTRDRLKAAAARLLEEGGYRDLRVSDINEAAGVSNALFYLYFKNKEEITGEILKEFLDELANPGERSSQPRSTEESIFLSLLSYIDKFSANSGLMYCLMQYGDEVPSFGKLWLDFNAGWARRVVTSLSRHGGLALEGDCERTAATSALGVMTDGLLRLLYVDRISGLLEAVGRDPPKVALFLTKMWVRALFARDMTWTLKAD